jgi:hypothetical protein
MPVGHTSAMGDRPTAEALFVMPKGFPGDLPEDFRSDPGPELFPSTFSQCLKSY